jgi:AcrR family transcriptional regulator
MYRIRPLNAVGTDSSAATRAALIKAAAPLFAQEGFETTRTREIADKAKANVSAINYHFGSKMGLYQAVIKEQAEQMIATYPLQVDGQAGQSPEERFHHLVNNLLRRVLSRCSASTPQGRICVREFAEPTEALDFLVKEIVSHQFAITRDVIAAVIGREIPDEDLQRIQVSVVSQCFYYGMAEPMLTRLGVKIPQTDEEISKLATHIIRFSLAGIASSRDAA